MDVEDLKTKIKLSRKACEGMIGGILAYNQTHPLAQWTAELRDSKGVDNTQLVWHNIDRNIANHDTIVSMSLAVFSFLGLDKKNIKVKTQGEQ